MFRRLERFSIPFPLAARLVAGAYFIHSGWVKLMDPVPFLKALRLYHMLPESPPYFLNATAVIVPGLELVCGVTVLLGLLQRSGGLLMTALLCLFTPVVILRALTVAAEQGVSFFAVKFDCGCGTGVEVIWIKSLKNVGLLLLALFVAGSRYRRWSLAMLFDRLRTAPQFCRGCGYACGSEGTCDCDLERSVASLQSLASVPTPAQAT